VEIIKECLNYLIVAEPEIKTELTSKICQSLEKYSPSIKWEIDTLIKMLCLAGNYATEQTISSVINLIVSTQELNLYSVHKLYITVKNNLAQEGLVKVALYTIGEFGDILVKNSVQGPDNETIVVNEDDIISLLRDIQSRKYPNSTIKEYLLNTLIKLSVKCSPNSGSQLKSMIESENNSIFVEVQQRSNEYLVLFGLQNDNLKQKVLNSIPMSKVTKENEVKKELVVPEYENEVEDVKLITSSKTISKENTNMLGMSSSNNQKKNENLSNKNKDTGTNLLINDLNNIFSSPSTNQQSQSSNTVTQNPNNIDINNLFGNIIGNTPSSTNNQVKTNNDNNNLNNIFANINLLQPQQQNPSTGPQTVVTNNNIFNLTTNPQPSTSQTSSGLKQIFKNSDITLYSTSTKSVDLVNIFVNFSISNNGNKPLSNVKLQFSVPKYVERVINSPNGNNLTPFASFGIQQNIQLTNTQSDKAIVLKIRIIYNCDGKEFTETITAEDL